MSSIPANSSQPIQTVSGAELDNGVWDLLYDMPAWGISLLVHVAIIVLLMSITWVIQVENTLELESSFETEEIRQVEYVIDNEMTDEVGSMSDLNIVGPSMAAAQQQGLDTHKERLTDLNENILNPRLQIVETLPEPSEADVLETINLTGTTEHPGGTQGAIDRIVQEIASSLRERKTLVVWLFDESVSLEARRATISDRFEHIYRQLGGLDVDTEGALRTGIIGYGQDVHVLQEEPTADIDQLVKVVKGIQSDKSGQERVFAAIDKALKTYSSDKRRMKANMMLIVVTDERGDDYDMLETVVQKCAREGVKAYCIGNTSVFGREQGYVKVKWQSEDGEQFEEDLPADQGPETAAAEGLQLPFWTARGTNLLRMSSGYGPYTLSRLCAETGGVYFIADDTSRRKFDSAIMRQYSPDYRPLRDYQRQLSTNLAKSALVNAANYKLPDRNGDEILDERDIPVPVLRFQANNDNVLRQQVEAAQRPLAELDYFLGELHSMLEAGEKHRDRLDSDRWRAGYDLAMGRVLAMRVRAYGYNAMLAEMRSSPKPFSKEGSNQWKLAPAEEISAGATVRKMHKKALESLNRVIDEHPDTPWALMAQMELSEPLGWQWVEGTMQIAAMNQGGNNGNNPQFAPEEIERQRQARIRQQKKNASRPKI